MLDYKFIDEILDNIEHHELVETILKYIHENGITVKKIREIFIILMRED